MQNQCIDTSVKNKRIGILFKAIIAVIAAMLIFTLAYLVPYFFDIISKINFEYTGWFLVWEGVLIVASLPVLFSLVLSYIVSHRIQKDNPFCVENSQYMKYIAILLFLDSAFFLIVNIVIYFCGFSWVRVLVSSVIVSFFGSVCGLMFYTLSILTEKAVQIKSENDLTI